MPPKAFLRVEEQGGQFRSIHGPQTHDFSPVKRAQAKISQSDDPVLHGYAVVHLCQN